MQKICDKITRHAQHEIPLVMNVLKSKALHQMPWEE
ncbi:hypothetical protein M7I_7560 [Glarea lozoyensis 74030]|uniref:Uncharacterized protein n=1 Tax=Glarea lozoyensis (strain ATCC 74030 / MF5533) TaxID=1104152 RepID=H0EXM2_GLAL7|nr:hypothetical protein M7I_7560 [Glarea lozoyensis 74030]